MPIKQTKTVKINFQGKLKLSEVRKFVELTRDFDDVDFLMQDSRWYPGEGTSVGYLSATGDIE